jgi:hypothetical protein
MQPSENKEWRQAYKLEEAKWGAQPKEEEKEMKNWRANLYSSM